MRVTTVRVNSKTKINLGHEGENLVTQVRFSIAPWQEEFGAGSAQLIAQRANDEVPYPVAVEVDAEGYAVWNVSSADTAQPGSGYAEIRYYVDEALVKSNVFTTIVSDALGDVSPEPPQPYQDWVDQVLQAGAEAEQSAQGARDAQRAVENMTASAKALPAGSSPTVEKTILEGVVNLLFGIPRGEKGDKGDKGDAGAGIVSIEKTATSGLVDTYTVTLTDGSSYTLTVTNGAKGDKGERGEQGVGIQSIVKTSSAGLVDTYTITLTNGATAIFSVTNGEKGEKGDTGDKGDKGDKGDAGVQGEQGIQGEKGDTGATGNGISSIVKTSTAGLVDTYTITYTDGTSTTYTVTNGEDGAKGDKGDDYVLTQADKEEIADMVSGMFVVQVSGTTPTITAEENHRYVCGEVVTLDFTPPASGICDVVFTSGATATVLTLPNTVRWVNDFDPTSLEANTTYEINIMDGIGVAVGVSA